MIIDIFNYSLTAILIGISAAWIFLIRSMLISFKMTPYLDDFKKLKHDTPKVSIILPARNEE
ncbi:MAG: glycosyl transferase, partial [Nitrosopumilaceae archaeon]